MTLIQNKKILIIDDDPDINFIINKEFENKFELVFLKSIKSAKEQLKKDNYGLIILDNKLPDGDGIDFVKELSDHTPVILLTAYGDEEIAAKSIRLGAKDYVKKEQGFEIILKEIIDQYLSKYKVFRNYSEFRRDQR